MSATTNTARAVIFFANGDREAREFFGPNGAKSAKAWVRRELRKLRYIADGGEVVTRKGTWGLTRIGWTGPHDYQRNEWVVNLCLEIDGFLRRDARAA